MNQNGSPPHDEPEKEKQPDPAAEPVLSLDIGDGGLSAALFGGVPAGLSAPQIKDLVVKLLGENQIKNGVLAQAVVDAVKKLAKGEQLQGMVVAQGVPPEPGLDARVEVLVDLDSHRIGRLLEDGRIDFRDKGPLPLVTPDTRLAVLHPGEQGKPGLDVRGKKINPPLPRQLKLRGGPGVRIDEEGMVAVATADGIPNQPEEGKYEVLEVLEIRGDIDFASGHVNFPGKVRVSGTVLSDFKVQAKSLEAEEMEPGSAVEVSGDLTMRSGIMGAKVKAGGKIKARYVRDSTIICDDDLLVETEIVHSRIQCGGRVRITHGDGRIVNSQIDAIRGVITGMIVSSGIERHSIIRLGVTSEFLQEYHDIRQKLKDIDKKSEEIEKSLAEKKEELEGTEDDLRNILASLKDPAHQDQRENLMGQVEMMKPIRNDLKNQLAFEQKRLEEIQFVRQELQEKNKEMEAVMPPGVVWLDVRLMAEGTTEIRGPRAYVVLGNQEQSFSATELEVQDEKTGTLTPVMKLRPLRSSAR